MTDMPDDETTKAHAVLGNQLAEQQLGLGRAARGRRARPQVDVREGRRPVHRHITSLISQG